MGTGSAVIPKKRGDTKPHKETTKEIKQARGTPGRRRTQETQGNTTQSLRALRSLRSLCALRSYTGERETRDHKKHQGTPARLKNTRGPKEHKTRNSLPKCCERPAAREQKAKENITKIPFRRLPKWYRKPPQIDQKTSPNETKMVPQRGITKKHQFCFLFLPHLAPPGPPRRSTWFQKVYKNI